MRKQYLSLACLLGVLAGLAIASGTVEKGSNWLPIWLLFSIASGMILNLPISPPKVVRESFTVSGAFCLTVILRNFHGMILGQLAGNPPVWCISGGCYNPSTSEIIISLSFLMLVTIVASFAVISISTLSGKLLLQYAKLLLGLDPEIFEKWKKVITGAISFGSIVFMAAQLVG